MAPLEAVFIWSALALYALASWIAIYSFVFGKSSLLDRIAYFAIPPFVCQTAAIIARYYAVGNLPVAGDYENSLGLTWIIAALLIYVILRHKSQRGISVAVMPLTLLILGYGVMRSPKLEPMAASVRSFWLYIHVSFAWLAFGAYVIAFGMGVVYILKEKREDKELYKRFPSLPVLDDLMFKYLVFGFITDAVMIASGALWAKDLWGNYWSWDPVEMWSLLTWLIYGLAIHLRVTMGWRGRRLAWIVIFALSGMVATYFGINLLVKTSLHFFEAWKEI